MARRYRMTPARRAALKKAQAASARKRRRNRRIVVGAAAVGVSGAALVARHKLSGSSFSVNTHGPVGAVTKNVSGSRKASLSNSALGGGARRISYQTKKQGPLGSSKSYSYNHQPIIRRKPKARRRVSGPVPFEAPTKTYGGIPIMSATEFSKPKSVTFPSRIIDQKPFRPNRRKNPLSIAKVQGKTIDSYFHDFDKRHGLQRKRRRK